MGLSSQSGVARLLMKLIGLHIDLLVHQVFRGRWRRRELLA